MQLDKARLGLHVGMEPMSQSAAAARPGSPD